MCIGIWDKNTVPVFALVFIYCLWKFLNDKVFEGKWLVYEMSKLMDNMVAEFIGSDNFSHS